MALILIVDDEHVVRQVLARWIQGAGHQILEADSADAALHVMEKQPAAVVFCDIQMPGHDGIWLTTELRKLYRETAVVLATGVSTVGPRVSMQSGVLAYLVKPLSHDSVIEALEIALVWHRGDRRHRTASRRHTRPATGMARFAGVTGLIRRGSLSD